VIVCARRAPQAPILKLPALFSPCLLAHFFNLLLHFPESLVLPSSSSFLSSPYICSTINLLVVMSANFPVLVPILLGYNGHDLWFVVGLVIVGWLPMLLYDGHD
jgi:hypothetical protein